MSQSQSQYRHLYDVSSTPSSQRTCLSALHYHRIQIYLCIIVHNILNKRNKKNNQNMKIV